MLMALKSAAADNSDDDDDDADSTASDAGNQFGGIGTLRSTKMMDKMCADAEANTGEQVGAHAIAMADEFTCTDPVKGSVAQKQGIRLIVEVVLLPSHNFQRKNVAMIFLIFESTMMPFSMLLMPPLNQMAASV